MNPATSPTNRHTPSTPSRLRPRVEDTGLTLEEKAAKARAVMRQAIEKYGPDKVGIAWTGGKDSTLMLALLREEYEGNIPVKALFIDTTLEFDEIYAFVEEYRKKWGVDLVVEKDLKTLEKFNASRDPKERKELARIMKVNCIQQAIDKYQWKALITGIRRDEHEARSHETYFSPRKDHVRVHPILDFTEKDVWDYHRAHNVPYVKLYDEGYRSLGEKEFTEKVPDPSLPERAGREKEKEAIMEKLRGMGYF